MRALYFTILLCISTTTLQARHIPLEQAKKYAVAAYQLYAGDKGNVKAVSVSEIRQHVDESATTMYYMCNMAEGGFVILSAEDRFTPVLGFSTEASLDFGNEEASRVIRGELSRYEDQIQDIRKGKSKSISSAHEDWEKIKAAAKGANSKSLTFEATVAPLTTTKWNQDGYYNASCPADTLGPNGRTYCGCLPIAISQLLRYYENPALGNGSVSYNDPTYGPQSVDLCGREFDYTNMPDVLTEDNAVLADFIYDVGKSMRTFYSTYYTATYVSTVQNVLVNYFGFDSRMEGFYGVDQARYSEVVRKDLDEGRIVFLSGWSIDSLQNADIGHTWLADGYGYNTSGVEYMHFNWGWGGNNNGWFLDTPGSWQPHEDNPEQEAIDYYWYRYTIHNIKPSGENCSQPYPNIPRAEAEETYAYLYYNTSYEELKRFRYRAVNSDDWIVSDETDSYYLFAGDLAKGTEYEYQVARNCCGGWSSYTDSKYFTTKGQADIGGGNPGGGNQTNDDCITDDADELFVTSLSDHFAFIYTRQPYGGGVNNQFRYRASGGEWIELEVSTLHYRALTDLASGTTYVYQVRHECEENTWSVYSESYTFTTTGEATQGGGNEGDNSGGEGNGETSACDPVDSADFTVGYASANSATAYLLRVSGGEMYRYRYKAVGSSTWTETSQSAGTSANLSGLSANTTYHVQLAQYCNGGWSEYSESNQVTTTGN